MGASSGAARKWTMTKGTLTASYMTANTVRTFLVLMALPASCNAHSHRAHDA